MKLLAMVLLTAGSDPPPPPSLIPGVGDFDIGRATNSDPCANQRGDEIVVCGHARIDKLPTVDPNRYVEPPLRVQTSFMGAKIDMHAEEHSVGGISAPAMMLSITKPF
ncbi:MAG: hypothetical protein JWO25_3123 [Alphaproteobacteria bacterium]|nr:hypothetical protein [Alphaproteobacteria bacterium]MDB5721458.1 hypothetical protein [Alphaproteobacteria bacterium]